MEGLENYMFKLPGQQILSPAAYSQQRFFPPAKSHRPMRRRIHRRLR